MLNVFDLALGSYCLGCSFLGNSAIFASADGAIGRIENGESSTASVRRGITVTARGLNGDRFLVGGEDGVIFSVSPDGRTDLVGCVERRWITSLSCGPGNLVAYANGRRLVVRDECRDDQHIMSGFPAEGLSFSPDGRELAVAGLNGVDLYRGHPFAFGRHLACPGVHRSAVYSPNGRFLITTMQAPALHGWRMHDYGEIEMLGYSAKVRSLSWSADGRWLATSGGPGAIVWPFVRDQGPGGTIPSLVGYRANSIATAVACHPSENIIATGFDDGLVGLVHTLDDRTVVVRAAGGRDISCLSWSKDGRRLAFGDEVGQCGMIGFN